VYTKTFDLPAGIPPGRRILLDLGQVHELATVKLNGQDLGVAWTKPARVDITSAVKARGNEIQIEIVNLWPNRLIEDSFLPADRQLTRTNIHRFTKASTLLPSGLIGPVEVLSEAP
jgi:hypothetical protein